MCLSKYTMTSAVDMIEVSNKSTSQKPGGPCHRHLVLVSSALVESSIVALAISWRVGTSSQP